MWLLAPCAVDNLMSLIFGTLVLIGCTNNFVHQAGYFAPRRRLTRSWKWSIYPTACLQKQIRTAASRSENTFRPSPQHLATAHSQRHSPVTPFGVSTRVCITRKAFTVEIDRAISVSSLNCTEACALSARCLMCLWLSFAAAVQLPRSRQEEMLI